jgi:hypothetical protein
LLDVSRPNTKLLEIIPMATTTKTVKKSAAQKTAEKLSTQIKALKEKRKVLSEQIAAKQTELTAAKEAMKAAKPA